MVGGAIKIEGLAGIQKTLKAVGTPTKELSAAGFEAAIIVTNTAKTLVPRRSGRLAATIKPARVARGAEGRAGSSNVLYANPIHFGWFKRHIKPNPFMYKALDNRREEVIQAYMKQMDDLIKKAVEANANKS